MFQQELIVVPFNKYHNLLNQNFELKNKLGIFDNNNIQEPLTYELITIESLQVEIVNLEEENKILNERILQLEKTNVELNQTISEQNTRICKLETENVQLKAENVQLKAEIVEIKKILCILTEKEHMQKVIMAVQDLNAIFMLEKHIKDTKLHILRDNRNVFCHYIDDKNDSDFVKMKKYEYIIDQLSTINATIKRKIESQYGRNIVQKIIEYVKPLLDILAIDVKKDDDITEEELNDKLTIFWE